MTETNIPWVDFQNSPANKGVTHELKEWLPGEIEALREERRRLRLISEQIDKSGSHHANPDNFIRWDIGEGFDKVSPFLAYQLRSDDIQCFCRGEVCGLQVGWFHQYHLAEYFNQNRITYLERLEKVEGTEVANHEIDSGLLSQFITAEEADEAKRWLVANKEQRKATLAQWLECR